MTTPNWEAIDYAIEVLNRIQAADGSVLPTLIAHRVPCNNALVDDPTVQVGETINPDGSTGPGYEVGFLGIINGLFGVDEGGWGYISANYDKGRLVNFVRSATPEERAAAKRKVANDLLPDVVR